MVQPKTSGDLFGASFEAWQATWQAGASATRVKFTLTYESGHDA